MVDASLRVDFRLIGARGEGELGANKEEGGKPKMIRYSVIPEVFPSVLVSK